MIKTALQYIAEARQEMLQNEAWDIRSLKNKKVKAKNGWSIHFDKIDSNLGSVYWTATSDKGESVTGEFGFDPMEPPLNDKEIVDDAMEEIKWSIDEYKKGRKDSTYKPGKE